MKILSAEAIQKNKRISFSPYFNLNKSEKEFLILSIIHKIKEIKTKENEDYLIDRMAKGKGRNINELIPTPFGKYFIKLNPSINVFGISGKKEGIVNDFLVSSSIDINRPKPLLLIDLKNRAIAIYEYVEFITLKELLSLEKPEQVEKAFKEALEQLYKLHSLGFTHRDFFEENIGVNGKTYLFDFELSKEVNKENLIYDLKLAKNLSLRIDQKGFKTLPIFYDFLSNYPKDIQKVLKEKN